MAQERLITDEEFDKLLRMAEELKLKELFEEPSSYEDEPEE